MKKILLFLLLASIIGCSKNSSTTKTTTTQPLILGKWHIQKDSDNFYYTNPAKNFNSVINYSNNYYIQFNSDGTGINSDTVRFTYKLSGTQLTFYNKAYTAGGYDYPPDTETVAVQKLTSNNLNIYFDYKVNEPGYDEIENNIYEYLTK